METDSAELIPFAKRHLEALEGKFDVDKRSFFAGFIAGWQEGFVQSHAITTVTNKEGGNYNASHQTPNTHTDDCGDTNGHRPTDGIGSTDSYHGE